jgi:hypothetical protein
MGTGYLAFEHLFDVSGHHNRACGPRPIDQVRPGPASRARMIASARSTGSRPVTATPSGDDSVLARLAGDLDPGDRDFAIVTP